ncbi:hypothetical protein [Saccharopolyspora gloriosae]|uniref:hypothetical protein n=1 Tax=Saccharopolyspora gloriosae TaxID=455344 RepID=UPI001FB6EAC0|nr:hypothetical protein [Saccharopolyspora gloriosae]
MAVEAYFGSSLPHQPKMSIADLSVTVGPYLSPEAHESHFLATIGSGDWHPAEGDEIRFDPKSRSASSLILRIPEENAAKVEPPVNIKLQAVSLTLAGRDDLQRFELPSAIFRRVAPGGKSLTCAWTNRLDSAMMENQFEIASSLSLISFKGEVVGWNLDNPERFLVGGWRITWQGRPIRNWRVPSLATSELSIIKRPKR